MENEPLVSILIPVYNRESIVRETIESAINQTYENCEIIIVDNNSTDSTWSIILEYSTNIKIKVYKNSKNIGPVENWKKCFDYSSGKYVKLLFSDDVLEYNFISSAVSKLNMDISLGFVYSRISVFNNQGEITRSYGLVREGKYKSSFFIESSLGLTGYMTPVSPCAALFRRNSFSIRKQIPNKLNVNHYNNGAGIDLFIYLDACVKYDYFYYIDETLVHFREHGEGFSVALKLNNEYLSAKTFFLENYNFKKLANKFNLVLYLKKNNINFLSLYNNSSFCKISWTFFFRYVIRRIKGKLNRLQS